MSQQRTLRILESYYKGEYGTPVGQTRGTIWYVDSVNGNAAYNGKTWQTAFATIGAAVTAASAGDTILLFGSFSEAVTCSTANIKFIGAGAGPKEAIWTAPTVAASFCLKPSANYITVENIYFKPVVYVSSGVPSAIRLSGSNWLTVKNCRFQGQTGSYTAIYSPVADSDNVRILDNEFLYMNTATNGCAIQGVEAGGLSYSGWRIEGNVFASNLKHIDLNLRASLVKNNTFTEYGVAPAGTITQLCTKSIDLSGTSSGGNVVTGNVLGGAYTDTLYTEGAAGDVWRGNFVAITSTTGAYGVSVEPAA